ncbi:MAG: hypothetical protein ACOX88_06390 [Christensenellales bacterium]|jgi:hypothetical protein
MMKHRSVKPRFLSIFLGGIQEKPLRLLYCVGAAIVGALLLRYANFAFHVGDWLFTLSFWALPALAVSVLFGPAAGMITGALSHAGGTLLLSGALSLGATAYLWEYTLTAGLMGAVPGLYFIRFPRRCIPTYAYLLLAVASAVVIFPTLIDSAIAALLSGGSYSALLFPAAVCQIPLAALYALIIYWIYILYDRIVNPLNE